MVLVDIVKQESEYYDILVFSKILSDILEGHSY